jgi:hypothetical protein
MDDTTFPLMTRRQFVEFVQRQTGIPLTYSRLMKDGAIGRAPKPTTIFGKRYLYSEADALSYAKALVRSRPHSPRNQPNRLADERGER